MVRLFLPKLIMLLRIIAGAANKYALHQTGSGSTSFRGGRLLAKSTTYLKSTGVSVYAGTYKTASFSGTFYSSESNYSVSPTYKGYLT